MKVSVHASDSVAQGCESESESGSGFAPLDYRNVDEVQSGFEEMETLRANDLDYGRNSFLEEIENHVPAEEENVSMSVVACEENGSRSGHGAVATVILSEHVEEVIESRNDPVVEVEIENHPFHA